MGSKIWIINILLLAMVLFCLVNAYDVWFGQDVAGKEAFDIGQGKKQNDNTQALVKKIKNVHPPGFYDPVVLKNLFSPDRTDLYETVTAQEQAAAAQKQKTAATDILLYGVLIMGEERKALISNPFPEKDENMIIWVKEGDRLEDGSGESGMTIKEIQNERIVVSTAAKDFEYYVFEAKDDLVRSVPTTAGESINRKPDTNSPDFGRGPGGDRPEMPFEISPDGEYKIYETPFGKIKRRIN